MLSISHPAAQGSVLNARRESRLDELAQRLSDQYGLIDAKPRAIGVPGDASDDATIDAMLNAAQEHFGKPADLIIANAGRGLNGSVMTSDTSQWEEMIRTNLLGVSKLIRRSGEQLLALNAQRDWSKHACDIVVLGSTVGRHISPFSSMYGATKFGVNSLAEAARRELGPKGIRVTLIEPGIVKSEFQSVAGYDPGFVWRSHGEVLPRPRPRGCRPHDRVHRVATRGDACVRCGDSTDEAGLSVSDLNLDTESIVCFSTDYAREQLENDGAHDFLPYVIFVKKKRKGLLYEITAFADPFDMIDDIGLQTFLDKTARKSICETLRKRKYVLACLIWIDELSNALKYSGGLIRTETHDKTGVCA